MWMVFMTQHANCKRYSCKKLLRYMALVLPRGLGADHLTLEGGGGVMLKKKFLQALVGRKKLHAAQMK